MKPGKASKWPGLSELFLAVFFLATLLASIFGRWRYLVGDAAMSPVFADLRQVTSASECLSENNDWDIFVHSCDPFGRPYNYSTLLPRLFAFLNIGEEQTGLVGAGFALLMVLALLGALRAASSRTWDTKAHLLFILMCGSPPILLLIERGNSDLLVFSMTVMAALLIFVRKVWAGVVASILVLLSVGIKFFPVGAVFMFVRPTKMAKNLFIGTTFAAVSILLLGADEWNRARLATPGPLKDGFGVVSLFRWVELLFGLGPHEGAGYVWSLLAFVTLLLFAMKWLEGSPRNESTGMKGFAEFLGRDDIGRVLTFAGTMPLLVVFLLGSSFDYRLVFLLLPALAVLRWRQKSGVSFPHVLYLIICALWFSYHWTWPFQLLGDLALVWVVVLLTSVCANFTIKSFWPKKSGGF